jgi:YQGE family putative transporter
MNEKSKHRLSAQWSRSLQNNAHLKADAVDALDPLGEGMGLGRQGVLLLVIHTLFAVAGALSTTFVNIFLWKVSNDYALIGWFNLFVFLSSGVTFFLMGGYVKRANKMISLRAGIALSAIFYLAVLMLGKAAVDYVIWLGILHGMGSGLYWLAFNVVYFEITNPINRDRFNGLSGFWGSFSWMIAPWVAGWVISSMNNTIGYRTIFMASLVTFSIAAVISFFLKHRKAQGPFEFGRVVRGMRSKNNLWRSLFAAMVAQGAREGVFAFLIGLFVYNATQNEMKLGTYNLITSGVALVTYFFIGKFLKPEWRKRSMMIGTIMLSIVILPLFWKLNYTTLIWFGIGTNLFLPLYIVPLTSIVFDAIGKDHDSAEHRVEFVVLREIGLNLGRVLSVLVFITVVLYRKDELALTLLTFIVGTVPILAWFAIRTKKLESFVEDRHP